MLIPGYTNQIISKISMVHVYSKVHEVYTNSCMDSKVFKNLPYHPLSSSKYSIKVLYIKLRTLCHLPMNLMLHISIFVWGACLFQGTRTKLSPKFPWYTFIPGYTKRWNSELPKVHVYSRLTFICYWIVLDVTG